MPYIETPDELAETLANLVGVYGAHDGSCGTAGRPICRVCWTQIISDRIRASVKNEAGLKV